MKSIITLVLICVLSAVSLAYIKQITEPIQQKIQEEKLKKAKIEVLNKNIRDKVKDIVEFKKEDNIEIFKVLNKNNNIISYIARTVVNGFGGEIKLLIGINNKKISGVSVLSHLETPGLGAKIDEVNEIKAKQYKKNNPDVNVKKPWFCEQFKNKKIQDLKLKNNNGEIDAITASTISSRVVTKAVQKTLETVNKIVE